MQTQEKECSFSKGLIESSFLSLSPKVRITHPIEEYSSTLVGANGYFLPRKYCMALIAWVGLATAYEVIPHGWEFEVPEYPGSFTKNHCLRYVTERVKISPQTFSDSIIAIKDQGYLNETPRSLRIDKRINEYYVSDRGMEAKEFYKLAQFWQVVAFPFMCSIERINDPAESFLLEPLSPP